jgi:hypothetical protein
MKNIIMLIAILLFLPSFAFCEAPSSKQMDLINWMIFYYQNPEPNKLPEKLAALSETGLLNDEKRQFFFLGFASSVFHDNPDKIKIWVPEIDNLPQVHKKIIFLALWLSNTKEAKDLFLTQKYKEAIAGENYFNFETDKTPPSLDYIDRMYGGCLDIQWGRFLATGKKEYIHLIIGTLGQGDSWGASQKYSKPLSEDQKKEIIKEAYFKSALWSLQSNCKTHPLVKKYCSEIYEAGNLSAQEKKYLGILLSQVYPEKYKKTKNRTSS